MTTIAYRDGIMAADSCVVYGDGIAGHTKKLMRVKGAVIGYCGDFSSFQPFCKWYEAGADPAAWPAQMERIGAMVASRAGLVRYDGPHPMFIEHSFHSIGSGFQAALGAMHMGASAVGAVKIATKVDLYSGGPVRTLKCPEVRP